MILSYKTSSFIKVLILFAASVASLGTVPYGFRFAHVFSTNEYVFFTLGIILGICSGTANMILGSYSLLNFKFIKKFRVSILLMSLISAVPMGFITFYSYRSMLSVNSNLILTIVVIIVNSGISYTAINNLIDGIKKMQLRQINYLKIFIQCIGFIIGFLVSTAAFMASICGIHNILIHYHIEPKIITIISYLLGFFTWIPYAALFSNATQQATLVAYKFVCSSIKSSSVHLKSRLNLFILVFAIASGAAFAQITKEFFDPSLAIPTLFKGRVMQYIIYNYLVPTAMLSSAAVNYHALTCLLSNYLDI